MNYSLIVILIIIILISYILFNNLIELSIDNSLDNSLDNSIDNNIHIKYLDGYWISQDEFNKASDIDKMILYIDKINNIGTLIIIINNQIVSNEEYQLYIDEENIKFQDLILQFNISFQNNKKKDYVWNNKTFHCSLNIQTGNIKLFNHKDKIIFGDFIKDNIISNYINQ